MHQALKYIYLKIKSICDYITKGKTWSSTKEKTWSKHDHDHQTWFSEQLGTQERKKKKEMSFIDYWPKLFNMHCTRFFRASWVAQVVENPLQCRRPWVRFLGWEVPLEKGWLPTPVFLPGEPPWTEEPGRLQSMGLQRVGHDWVTKHSTLGFGLKCKRFIPVGMYSPVWSLLWSNGTKHFGDICLRFGV